ncbi:MAG: hypothetical protein FWD57_13415, partial [Polyangiaceae bacterium]|nr:hypothetical protein [Polyangiaceae bacterium]
MFGKRLYRQNPPQSSVRAVLIELGCCTCVPLIAAMFALAGCDGEVGADDSPDGDNPDAPVDS